MGRLQHYYERLIPFPEDKPSFDVLLLDTYMGKLVITCAITNQFDKLETFNSRTLTELKKKGIESFFYPRYEVGIEERQISNGTTFFTWEKPFELGCHTEADENYGDVYNGYDLVYEGNRYGDVSRFLILGYIR